MTRLPAPVWWQPPVGRRAHRLRKLWRPAGRDDLLARTRCGVPVPIGPDAHGELLTVATMPVCAVCVPSSRRADR